MFPSNLPSGIYPSGDMTITTNDATAHFFEYKSPGGPGVQDEKEPTKEVKKKKPKTWQEKTDEERDDNLRRLFGYD